MQAALSFPLDTSLSAAEVDATRLAYYKNGIWVDLPTSIDKQTRTASATISHFTIIALRRPFRLFNRAPTVVINPTPSIYYSVEYELYKNMDSPASDPEFYAQVPDLVVDLYVKDPDDKLSNVAFGIECLDSQFHQMLYAKLRDAFYKAEATVTIMGLSGDLSGMGSNQLLTELQSEIVQPKWCLSPIDLPAVDEDLGHYQVKIRVKNLPFATMMDKMALRLYVYAWDDSSIPIETYKDILFTTDKAMEPPKLQSPGPTIDILCPPSPQFSFEYDYFDVKSWGPDQNNILRESDAGFYPGIFTPPEPLEDGFYSWGVVACEDENENKFGGSDIDCAQSITYQFQVVSDLHLSSCIPANQVMGTLELENSSDEPICELYIPSKSLSDWGNNYLDGDEPVQPGELISVDLPGGNIYSLLAQNCNGETISVYYDAVEITPGKAEFLAIKVQPYVQINNYSTEEICTLYSKNHFDLDKSVSYDLDPIQPGATQQIQLDKEGTYDFRIVSCDGAEMLRENDIIVNPRYMLNVGDNTGDASVEPQVIENADGSVTYVITETMIDRQMENIMNISQLDQLRFIKLKGDPVVFIREEKLGIRAKAKVGPLTGTLEVSIRPYIDNLGQVQVDIVEAKMGLLPLPTSALSEIEWLRDSLVNMLQDITGAETIRSIEMSYGEIKVTIEP